MSGDRIPSNRALVPAPKPRKRGRPSKYTPALGRAICRMLVMGLTVREIGRRERMPRESTIRWWAAQPDHPFAAQYTRAREIGYHRLVDDLLGIADDGIRDYVMQDGALVFVPEAVARARLRIDTRKWLLAKALPKMYGDKLETTHTLDATDAFVRLLQQVSPDPGSKPKMRVIDGGKTA